MGKPSDEPVFLADLEARHDNLLCQLEDLEKRVQAVLCQYLPERVRRDGHDDRRNSQPPPLLCEQEALPAGLTVTCGGPDALTC